MNANALSVLTVVIGMSSAATAEISNYQFFFSEADAQVREFISSSNIDQTFSDDYQTDVQFKTGMINSSISANGSRSSAEVSGNLDQQGFTFDASMSTSSTYWTDGFRTEFREGIAVVTASVIFTLDESTTFSFQSMMNASSGANIQFSLSQSVFPGPGEIYLQGDTDLGDTGTNTNTTLGPGDYRFGLDMYSTTPHDINGSIPEDFGNFSAQLIVVPSPSTLGLLALSGVLSIRRRS